MTETDETIAPPESAEPTRLRAAIVAIGDEWKRATEVHGPMRSPHEGYAVLWEEVAESFDALRADEPVAFAAEVTQVGAMAVRYTQDCQTGSGDARAVLAAAGALALTWRPTLSLADGYGRLLTKVAPLFVAIRTDRGAEPDTGDACIRIIAIAARIVADVPELPE